MKNLLLISLIISSCSISFGQKFDDPYVICMNRYLKYRDSVETIIKQRTGYGLKSDTVFVKMGFFFDRNRLSQNIKLLSEQDISNLTQNGNIINLIEIRPITFDKDSMYINIRDTDVSKNSNEIFYMLKGGGIYKIWFNCISNKLEITTISETI